MLRLTILAAISVPIVAQLTLVSGQCTLDNACVQSSNHPADYQANDYCEITATIGVPLVIEAFSIEAGYAAYVSYDEAPQCNYDYLRISGVDYCNSIMPPIGNTSIVPSSSEIIFFADSGTEDTGFRICQYTPPTPPTAST